MVRGSTKTYTDLVSSSLLVYWSNRESLDTKVLVLCPKYVLDGTNGVLQTSVTQSFLVLTISLRSNLL